jgi:hypothetical protein
MGKNESAVLLDVVEVEREKRVRCQAGGCGHGVYARIHVVLVDGSFLVLGGDCFQRLYGNALKGATSRYGGSSGAPTRLDDEMRNLLSENTAEFIERLEARRREFEARAERERLAAQAAEQARMATREAARPAPQRFEYPLNDPSTAPYEGAAMLRWRWASDVPLPVSGLSDTTSQRELVVRCYKGFDRKHPPHKFAMAVEMRYFLPKSLTLRTLHQLGLIEQG